MPVLSSHKTIKVVAGTGSTLRGLLGGGLLVAVGCLPLGAQVSVTTWGYDNARDNLNANETVLTPSNVNATQFGKLFSQTVDGYVYAQPLYLPNLTIGGQSHNVVFVATEHDGVYAFDADTNSGINANPLWYDSLSTAAFGAAAGETTVPWSAGSDIVPEVGITGTPVIDPASGTLYVVSKTVKGNTYFQRLHALDVTTGAEKFGGPVLITASSPGTGNGSVNGTLTFDPQAENQRPALLLLNGIVYIGFAAHEDGGNWHGWILGYNAQTLQQTGVFCTSPNGTGSGIWMSGAGLAAEVIDPVNHPYGRMFVPMGNGDYTATKPYAAGMDFGDSILNLDLTNGVPTVQDEFTPTTQAGQDANDDDQAAGGLLILPTQTTGSFPHLAVQAGKTGCIFLVNRENLGGFNSSYPPPTNDGLCAGDQVVVELQHGAGGGVWSSPAFWNGKLYYWVPTASLWSYPLTNGILSYQTAQSSETYAFPGATPSISANGNTQGIAWSIDTEAFGNTPTPGPAVLQAHNATPAGSALTTLYSSSTNLSRDNPGPAVKFTVPTVANGKVYVGAEYKVSIFGLLNSTPVAATPTFNPGAESFSGSVPVSIIDGTSGATIYYTLDGSTPTTHSSIFTPGTPINITATTTITAIATATGYTQSPPASATYVLSSQAATPTFTPPAGTYTSVQSVAISTATTTGSPAIFYTTDGSNPATSGTAVKYATPVSVSASETLNAVAEATGFNNSAIGIAAYTINLPAASTPTFSPTAGTYASVQQVAISTTTTTGSPAIFYTTDGSNPATSGTAVKYTAPLTVSKSETVNAVTEATGFMNSAVGSAVYTITVPVLLTPAPGSVLGSSATFTWSSGTGVTQYELTLGSTGPGSSNLYNSGHVTTTSTGSITLPTNSVTIYAELFYYTGGVWRYANYTYFASGPPAINSPAPGSVLGSSATFKWSPGSGSTMSQLLVGTTGPGSSNLFNSGQTSATSATVTGIPETSATIYATLQSFIGGSWQSTNYTYTESPQPVNPVLTSPTPGSVLPPSANFIWSTGTDVTQYEFVLGTTPGSSNIYNSGHTSATSTGVITLPTNSETIYGQLFFNINANWLYSTYTFIAAGPAAILSPTPGSVLPGSSVRFTWSPGTGATQSSLALSTTSNMSNIVYNSGQTTATSANVTGLPTNSAPLFAQLGYYNGSVWQYVNSTYTEAPPPAKAALLSPAQGSVLGSSAAFSWTTGSDVTQYAFWLGTAPGTSNIYNSGHITGTTTGTISLPTNGVKVYAQLYSYMNGAWVYTLYTFTEQ